MLLVVERQTSFRVYRIKFQFLHKFKDKFSAYVYFQFLERLFYFSMAVIRRQAFIKAKLLCLPEWLFNIYLHDFLLVIAVIFNFRIII